MRDGKEECTTVIQGVMGGTFWLEKTTETGEV